MYSSWFSFHQKTFSHTSQSLYLCVLHSLNLVFSLTGHYLSGESWHSFRYISNVDFSRKTFLTPQLYASLLFWLSMILCTSHHTHHILSYMIKIEVDIYWELPICEALVYISSHAAFHLLFIFLPHWGWKCYYPLFTGEETGFERLSNLPKSQV